MRAIHFKCGRDDGLNLNNLHYDKTTKLFRSGQWNISEDDARILVGGWLYLHPAKSKPSEFGGIIRGYEPVVDDRLARAERIVLIVQKQPQGTGQRWRGQDHAMAHSSGLVAAGLPHEMAPQLS